MKTCYDSTMKLEVEGEAGLGKRSKPVTVKFLQANVTFKKNTIEMSENNKNAAHIEEHGTQKLQRYPHFKSYAPNSQKLAIYVQNMLAIDRFTSTTKRKQTQVEYLKKEMNLLGYKKNIYKKALCYMRRRFAEWNNIE